MNVYVIFCSFHFTHCCFFLGLPNTFGGYDESPETMSSHLREFATANFVNLVNTLIFLNYSKDK